MYTTYTTTRVKITNPSGAHALQVSYEAQRDPKVQQAKEYTEDTLVGTIQPHALGSIGGGQFDWNRQFKLLVDSPTVLEVVDLVNRFVVELNEEATDDFGPYYKKTALETPKRGTKYELDKGKIVSVRLDPRDEDSSEDGAFINFRSLGGAVRIVQQTRREMVKRSPGGWSGDFTSIGEISPGATREFPLNDKSRLILSSRSSDETMLSIANPSTQHSLKLESKDGTVHVPPAAVTGSGYESRNVIVKKGAAAIVQQAPL